MVIHKLYFAAAPTSEWSEWSECTALCGGGTRFRTRECTGGGSNCVTDEQEDCNSQDCEPEPELIGMELSLLLDYLKSNA